MDLRVPSGGRSLLSWWGGDSDDDARSLIEEDSADVFSDVSTEDVADALGQLFDGNFEYVGLEGEDGWIQTADAPGGYVFERSVSDDGVVAHPVTLSADEVRAAFLAFHGGDVDCGLDWSAAPAGAGPKPKKGWFRR